ncbi:IGF-like family receptor 1 isoform X1 [Platichthys flesus]|uniref:IGF-like family receptor 1 isoform X1 n=1 Tax=Platichthys flesus TaxID=8260 RepID=UPI002DB76598|nr:IGF-like family receptor 1 isoform X1 [Platichthys flesus]
MGHSKKCTDLTTYYDTTTATCVPCKFKPGYGVNPNCGYGDDGGRHDVMYSRCEANRFNDGSRALCVNCTSCPPGSNVIRTCDTTTDTECEEPSGSTSQVPVKIQTDPPSDKHTNFTPTGRLLPTTFNPTPAASSSVVIWAVPLTILICITLSLISAYIIYMKRNKGLNIEREAVDTDKRREVERIFFGYMSGGNFTAVLMFLTNVCVCVSWSGGDAGRRPLLHFSKRSSLAKEGFAPLSAWSDDVLSPDILSAPLQTVLNNLDVLEELVILLDPESQFLKNTKHLASQCSFPSTWITYTYSMKDSKSPLKALLERVTSSHPDWTVGHLAKLLSQMERNDAIAVLAQLQPTNSPA